MVAGAHLDPDSGVGSLNPKFTFDSFVAGACNQFAHAAARHSPGSACQRLDSELLLISTVRARRGTGLSLHDNVKLFFCAPE
jgi:chromosomal replication initiation ATPase DnaA